MQSASKSKVRQKDFNFVKQTKKGTAIKSKGVPPENEIRGLLNSPLS